jgi:predicted dehydrogenase
VPLRIGLIGCGRWGRVILRDLLAIGVEAHVFCRTDATAAEAMRLGACSAKSDYSGLEHMDGFVVATPTATHAEVIEWLVPTGRPIFVEKPMTADLASARRVTALAGDRLFVMDKWRYHPGIDAMRQLIAAGRLGEVLAIKTTRWGWGNPHRDVSALWILAPHDLAIVLHLIGWIPPVCSAAPVVAGDTELGFVAYLGADRGPAVMIDIGTASPGHYRRCLVIGTEATAELRDGYDQQVFTRDGPPGALSAREGTLEVGGKMPLLAELEQFANFLLGGTPPMSVARHGLLVIERLDAIETALVESRKRAAGPL